MRGGVRSAPGTSATSVPLFLLLLLLIVAQEARCRVVWSTQRGERLAHLHHGTTARSQGISPRNQQSSLLADTKRSRTRWSRLGFCGSAAISPRHQHQHQQLQQHHHQQPLASRARGRGTPSQHKSRARWSRHCFPPNRRDADVGILSLSMTASPSQRSALRPNGDAARVAPVGYGSASSSTQAQRGTAGLDAPSEEVAGKLGPRRCGGRFWESTAGIVFVPVEFFASGVYGVPNGCAAGNVSILVRCVHAQRHDVRTWRIA